jgi:two-component system CheB/CheR fusion protein
MAARKGARTSRKQRLPRPARPKRKAPDGGSEATRSTAGCPVVAIGASAGGLQAYENFFSRMPPDSGLAFVLVPHLDATHKSAMTELIQRHTKMPVAEITDRMPIGANRVYVVPPGAMLAVTHATLCLERLRGHGMIIDAFLRSLAEDQEENAIGIILSGSGSDGTQGIKAIKEHGGLTMAQAAQTAGYDSMPLSAAATGQVDFVLPVEEMPARLIEYARHLRALRDGKPGDVFREEAARHLMRICMLLRAKTGHDFSRYKDSTLIRRLQRRMQVVQLTSVTAYVDLLRKDPREIELLFRDLLIGVTNFFRNRRVFDALAKEVIPAIIAAKGPAETIRIWVPGCASGEECYSIAILLREQLAGSPHATKAQIFATDIDEESLETARLGRYPASIARDLTPERLERNFTADGDFYRVSTEIREMCIFSVHNLIRDAPFSKLDLVSCRNLLIYLDASLQNRIIPLFHFALRHGGYLLLGPSENVTQHSRLFTVVDAKNRIFKARAVAAKPLDFAMPTGLPQLNGTERTVAAHRTPEDGLSRRAMRAMEAYAPAYVIVDEQDEIMHFSGRTGKYLQPSAGAASLNLFNVLDTALRPDVRAALRKAAAGGQTVIQENVQAPTEGGMQLLNIIVEPLPAPEASSRYFIVGFQDIGAARPRRVGETKPLTEEQRDETIAHLEAELRVTRERLQSTVEELETSNEEMRASNEEFQSVNEELQSSNEELETSKEELQAVNEELETVNTELNSKIDSLERASSDRKNLLENIQIATIFLDSALHVMSFTPAITDILHLRESDIGREITDFVMRIDYSDLARDVRKVMRTLRRIEQEVSLADRSATYMMRILPYRTTQNVIDGVVITFIDITQRKRSEEDMARLAAIVDHSYDAIIGISLDGTVTTWNAGAERMYGRPAAEAIGHSLALLIPADRADELKEILDRVRRGRPAAPIETERVTKDGRRISITSSVSPIRNAAGRVVAASAIERDDTERKAAAGKQALLHSELNHRVKNTLAIVLSVANRTLRGSISLESFKDAFEGRLRALAAAHELLSASSWAGAGLRDILDSELGPHRQHGDRVAINGEPVQLKANAALVLGMIFHEMATNAAKHGALNNSEGRVDIDWETDADARLLRIRWRERDGPDHGVEAKTHRGFGRQLIERTVSGDLQGRAAVEFPARGCRWTLELPLQEVLAAPPPPQHPQRRPGPGR